MDILFVCLGNICRSPLAEGIFKHKIEQRGLSDHFTADSCGTSNYHIGDPPDMRTIANAGKHGIALHHLGRQLSPDDLDRFDMVIPMDKNNRKNILELENAAFNAEKIYMMRDFDTVSTGSDVPDPYAGKPQDFEEVFEILERSTEGLINHLTRNMRFPNK